MSISLYNSLTKNKDGFNSIKPNTVQLYSCGPTVYDHVHIGNLRAFVFADIVRRVFEYNGFEVKHVMNVTDVGHLSSDADEGEDKMSKALRRHDKPMTLEAMKEVADFYTDTFIKDTTALNIKHPHFLPKASEHIEHDIELIKKLQGAGVIYTTSDGVYFDTDAIDDYPKLGGGGTESSEEHSRIGVSGEKRNPRDFALWKFNHELGWETPWGKGFPGWHLECSAMSREYLGQPFDIHTGGVDHISVHHTNEIAQSETAYGVPLANYWLHNEHLILEKGRMGKSEGNAINLHTLTDEGYSPLAFRLFLLNAHYRSQLTFSYESLNATQSAVIRAHRSFANLGEANGNVSQRHRNDFKDAINDDLNTPKALAVFWSALDDTALSAPDRRATLLDFDTVLGLGLGADSQALVEEFENHVSIDELPEHIQSLITEREASRTACNYDRADELREKIRANGYEVEDLPEGPSIKKTTTDR